MFLIRPWGRSEKLPLTKLLNYFIVFVAVRVVYKNTHQHTSWRRTRRWSWWSSACSPCSPGRRSTPSGCSAWQGQPGFCELAPLTGGLITIAILLKDTAIIIMITRPWPACGRHGLAGSSGGDQSGRINSSHSMIHEFARSDWMGLSAGLVTSLREN